MNWKTKTKFRLEQWYKKWDFALQLIGFLVVMMTLLALEANGVI